VGLHQEPAERLKLHPYFAEVIRGFAAVAEAVLVIDGCYGLNRSGPMLGDAVELGWLLVSMIWLRRTASVAA
jgi:uncharacterized protein (DUF362 family)